MTTSLWQGWSTTHAEVRLTRIIAGLFDSVSDGSQTTKTIAEVVADLALTDDPAHVARRLAVEECIFAAGSLSYDLGEERLTLTPRGRRVYSEFRTALRPPVWKPEVRRVVLEWVLTNQLSEYDSDPDPEYDGVPLTLLDDPVYGWFYGRQFTTSDVEAATEELRVEGHLAALYDDISFPNGHVGVRVVAARATPQGRLCLEAYGGYTHLLKQTDPKVLSIQIDQLINAGNVAIASDVERQSSDTGRPD